MKIRWFAIPAFAVLLAVSTVLVGGCAQTIPVVETQQAIDVSAVEAYTLIQENLDNPDFIILDVRTPEEYEEGHIADAINVNFREETFREQLDMLDKDDTYLLFCRSGGRSGQTLPVIEELGFVKIYHMTGGMNEWAAEVLPMIK